MAESLSSTRHVLLIGIDFYLRSDERKSTNGTPLSIHDLQGCVNDVRDIEDFLSRQDSFQPQEIHALTSSPSETSNVPLESEDSWPTFNNIKKKFQEIIGRIHSGDFFLFHYSGHGMLIKSTSKSPTGREEDPSLVTMDYLQGKPAIRGWQLNAWLHELNKKGVTILVIIDSCYAASVWRWSNSTRTVGSLDTPNLAGDYEATQDHLLITSSRNSVQQFSWSINPEGFTVMAACAGDEVAHEQEREDKRRGIFTYELVKSLKQLSIKYDYCTIRDNVEAKMQQAHSKGQKPKVYGQGGLLFFQDMEPKMQNPIICSIKECEEKQITVPLGLVQGVNKGTEFRPLPSPSDVSFEVETVDNFTCKARIPPSFANKRMDGSTVYLAKWALSEPQRNFYLQSGFGNRFETLFRQVFAECIAGDPNFKLESQEQQANSVTLRKNENRDVSIYGPDHLTAYEGPAWVVDLQGNDEEKLAREVAIAAAHLAKHIHIYEIKNHSPDLETPFKIDLRQVGTSQRPGVFNDSSVNAGQHLEVLNNSLVELTFTNRRQDKLFLTVIFFGPGFCIRQISPSNDSPIEILPDRVEKFKYTVKIPNEFEEKKQAGRGFQAHRYREILRAIVTTENSHSFKSLEMPEIWEAIRSKTANGTISGARNLEEIKHGSDNWWMRDVTFFVKAQGE